MIWLRRVIAVCLFVYGVFRASTIARRVIYGGPDFTTNLALLVTAAIFVLAIGCLFSSAIFVLLWGSSGKRNRIFALALVPTLIFAGCLCWDLFLPLSPPTPQGTPPADTRYWDLSTGSHIAYWIFDPPPNVPIRPEPVVYLHGGPGLYVTATDTRFYSQFAQDGFRVFLFDQAGSGWSARLPAHKYSLHRAIADLEEIRKTIGAPRIILIGHSWGSVLAANYMAAHPGHVAKVVFYAPGPMWNFFYMRPEYYRTAYHEENGYRTSRFDSPPREQEAHQLFSVDPRAAERFVTQEELGNWWARQRGTSMGICPFHERTLPSSHERKMENLYVSWAMMRDMQGINDEPFGRLRSDTTPAIVLYGECDFVPWSAALDYRTTLKNAQLYYFRGAGHAINYEASHEMAGVIRDFLLDRRPGLPAYNSEQDPRPPKMSGTY